VLSQSLHSARQELGDAQAVWHVPAFLILQINEKLAVWAAAQDSEQVTARRKQIARIPTLPSKVIHHSVGRRRKTQ
jgi:hypothetical protein